MEVIMKAFKNSISLLLAVVMLCVLVVPAFAADSEKGYAEYMHFDSVFSIGDSNGMGYGLPGYKGNPVPRLDPDYSRELNYTEDTYKHGVVGSFPELVSTALGVPRENHTAMDYPALRAKDALHFLGGNVDMSGDEFFNTYYEKLYRVVAEDSGTDGSDIYGVGSYFEDRLSRSENDRKLVIMYSGAADVIFSTFTTLMDSDALDDIPSLVVDAVELMNRNYSNFLRYVPALIERVSELNPEAVIVIVGTFNPVKDLRLSEDSFLPIFDAAAVLSSMMNAKYEEWAKQYGCRYVDISNVETPTLEQNLTVKALSSDNPELVYHATPEGYKYIARQILKELRVENSEMKKGITVDLGSVKNIDFVAVDNKVVRNYSYNAATHELFIPYFGTTARMLTVTAKNDNGSTALYTYMLNFGSKGYTAYRLYATNSILGTCKNIVAKTVGVSRAILKLFIR